MGVIGVTGDVEDSEAWSTVSSRNISDSGPVSCKPAVLFMADTQLDLMPAVTADKTICFPSQVCKKKFDSLEKCLTCTSDKLKFYVGITYLSLESISLRRIWQFYHS